MMPSAIDQLEQQLWGACVMQRAARDQETIDRWQTDEFAHLQERFIITPLPAVLHPLVRDALHQWQRIEEKVCADCGVTRQQFLSQFAQIRTDFLAGGAAWSAAIRPLQYPVYGAVRNINWVNLFSWELPHADRDHADSYRSIGRMVTAIFYIEMLSRHGNAIERDDDGLKKIEARWRLVDQC